MKTETYRTFCLSVFLICAVLQNASAELTEVVGNKPLLAASYAEWPGIIPVVNRESRVYQFDVNGHEQFFYDSDAKDLNQALKDYAKADLKRHRVILLPGKGTSESAMKDHKFNSVWRMQIVGGIVKAVMSRHPDSELVWPVEPTIFIYVDGDAIKLKDLRFSEGLEIQSTHSLKSDYKKAIENGIEQLAGSAIHDMGQMFPWDSDAMDVVMTQLKGDVEWLSINAASAIGEFGTLASRHLPELQRIAEVHASERVKKSLDKSIEKIESAELTDPKTSAEFLALVKTLNSFAEMPQFSDK